VTSGEFSKAYQIGLASTIRFLRSCGASSDNAEESAQSAWAKGWERLHQLREERMIVSWVNAIATNEHRRALRIQGRCGPLFDLRAAATTNDIAFIDTARILTLCQPQDRRLFEQKLSGFSGEEIAINEGVSANALRIRMFRALRATVASLKERAVQLQKSACRARGHITG